MKVPDAATTALILRLAVRDSTIFRLVKDVVEGKCGLITIRILQKYLKAKLKVNIERNHLLKLVKIDLGLKWGTVKSQMPYENSAKNIVLRQMFAKALLAQILAGKTLLNFDETCFTGTTSRRHSFRKVGCLAQRRWSKSITSLSLFLTISSQGSIYYQWLTGTNNQATTIVYLIGLVKILDCQRADWRHSHILLLDNAPSHIGKMT